MPIMLIHVCVFYSFFCCSIAAESNGCDRDGMTCKAICKVTCKAIFPIWPFPEKVCWPLDKMVSVVDHSGGPITPTLLCLGLCNLQCPLHPAPDTELSHVTCSGQWDVTDVTQTEDDGKVLHDWSCCLSHLC